MAKPNMQTKNYPHTFSATKGHQYISVENPFLPEQKK